jgi:hypothetical protein
MDQFYHLFKKDPLDIYAHACMDTASLRYLNYGNVCDNVASFYGCMEEWLTRDLTNAIYHYYGTTSFDAVRPSVQTVYNVTTTCGKYPVYWDGYSENCYSKCLWEQVGVFDNAGKVKVRCEGYL